jgi:3-hydroxyisobutyrate dehydrogenase/2-hydroxy-3-oxopropionate reductase
MRTAVLGLGAMGGRMARRLVESGHEVAVWSRTTAKADALARLGARPASSPAEAARHADAVIVMVTDAAAVRAVAEGREGVLAGLRQSAVLVQMSTIAPDDVAWLASAMPAGAHLLDAPVLGSVAEAESGTLRILVGGPPDQLQRCAPVLEALGSPTRMGGIGAGSGAKLVANAALFGVVGLLGESLALARGLGLSSEAAFDVLAATPLAAQAERRRPALETGRYPARFTLALALKDAALVLDAAATRGVDVRLAAAMRTWLVDAARAGLSASDYTAVLAHIGAGAVPAPNSPGST